MFKDVRYQIGWLGKLDAILHALHVPSRFMRPVCDAYERSVCDGSPFYFDGVTYTTGTSSTANVTWSIKPLKQHKGK